MGWPAKSNKTGNSRFYDFRIIGYENLQNKSLGY